MSWFHPLSGVGWSCLRDLSTPLLGGYCGGVPPLPIPNREVKPACADGTAMQCGRVGGRPLLLLPPERDSSFRGKPFFVPVGQWRPPPVELANCRPSPVLPWLFVRAGCCAVRSPRLLVPQRFCRPWPPRPLSGVADVRAVRAQTQPQTEPQAHDLDPSSSSHYPSSSHNHTPPMGSP